MVHGGGAASQVVWSDKGLKIMASTPTYSEWFTRFMTVIFSRIGERRNQDAAIYIALILEIQPLLEFEWQLTVKQNNKERIRTTAENALFQIFTHCGSLRGYETPKVLLHYICHHILSLEESAVLVE